VTAAGGNELAALEELEEINLQDTGLADPDAPVAEPPADRTGDPGASA